MRVVCGARVIGAVDQAGWWVGGWVRGCVWCVVRGSLGLWTKQVGGLVGWWVRVVPGVWLIGAVDQAGGGGAGRWEAR